MFFFLPFAACAFLFCSNKNLPKSITRTTGGSAIGETSTRSSVCELAICSASARVMTPAWLPSAAITRTDGAELSSLRLTPFEVAIRDPPKQDGRGSALPTQHRQAAHQARDCPDLCQHACVRP